MRLEVLLILALILVGGLIYYKDGGFSSVGALLSFSETATTTEATTASSSEGYLASVGSWFTGWFTDEEITEETEESTNTPTRTPTKRPTSGAPASSLTTPEVAKQVEEKHQELEALPEEEKVDKLHSPASPYTGLITLKVGKAKENDPDKEYVQLSATGEVEISGWRLVSYVTDSKATIPEGSALLENRGDRDDTPIIMHAGETAYVMTGETPLKVSFKENLCTGYLKEYEDFYPSLKKQCPMPSDEMLLFGNIRNDDDECFEFVADIKQCEIPTDSELRDADITSRCRIFIEDTLDYEGCVDEHQDDADFDSIGVWRIYLDRSGELWLSTREIIRLLDDEGKVVDVLEY